MLRTERHGEVIRLDVARTLLGRGRYWTTCYLVDGTMIDTGCAHASAETLRALEGERVQRIVNTHTHEDHIGANGPLQRRRPQVRILAHPNALPVLADPRGEQPLHPYRRVMWGWPEPSEAAAVADGETIETERHRFEVLFTPGHAADHLCLYEPDEGWLFTGDLFVGGEDRALRHDCDVWGIIASLERVASRPASVLFPGSARVRTTPARSLRRKIDYYRSLGERVLELADRGWSEGAIVRELCGGPMWIELITLGHFSRRNLVRSYLRET